MRCNFLTNAIYLCFSFCFFADWEANKVVRPDKQGGRLKNSEEALIRKELKELGLMTAITPDTPDDEPCRRVVVSKVVLTIHKTKRVATLKLLHAIVKGGCPDDVLVAGGVAIALEESPITALLCADAPAWYVDYFESDDETPFRNRLADWVASFIAKRGSSPK